MILAMDQKTWRIELAVAACILAVAVVAFTLMLGHSLCKSMAGK
jgi:hypothetical protein